MKASVRMLPALAGLLLAVCIECFIAVIAASGGYDMRDRKLSLSAVSTNDFAVSEQTYQVAGAVPWLSFQSEQGIGSLKLQFAEPLESDIDVQLYYVPEPGVHFDRFWSVNKYLMKGTETAQFTLPPGSHKSLRLDIRGNFTLEQMEGYAAIPLSELTPAQVLMQIQPLRLLLMAVLAVSGFLVTAARKSHAKRGKRRILWMDALRILAAVLVILAHVMEPLLLLIPEGTTLRQVGFAMMFFFWTSNLLFFLLSGALLLQEKEETLWSFIGNRFMKVVLPLVICSFFYLRLSCATVAPIGQWLAYGLRALWSGRITGGPHLWLVYELLGAYMAAIPLRYMLRHMQEQVEKQVACLILILLSLRTAGIWFQLSLGVSVFLDGWIGIFLMGYFLTRNWMRRYDKFWYAAGIAALGISVWLSEVRADYRDLICNRSILMLCMAAALFIFVMHLERLWQPFGRVLVFCSSHSYTVLLLHWFVLYQIIYNGWLNSGLPNSVQLLVPIAACTVVSFILAAAVDQTVLAAAEGAIGYISRSSRNKKR